MKVVYQKSIIQQILQHVIDAENSKLPIEKFILTKNEYKSLQNEFVINYNAILDYPIKHINGFKIEVEDKE